MTLPWQKLPNADALFTRYFNPWCDDRQREFKGFTATRPDLITERSLQSATVDEPSPLNREGQSITLEQLQEMCAAALGRTMESILMTLPPLSMPRTRSTTGRLSES